MVLMSVLTNTAFATRYVVDRSDNSTGANGCLDGTDDDCSLNGAIQAANSNTGSTNTIIFDDGTISPDVTAVTSVILDASKLPTIADDNLSITGAGAVTIDGGGMTADMGTGLLTLGAAGIVVSGLNIYNWNGAAIRISTGSATIDDNRLGIDGSGNVGLTAVSDGVFVFGSTSGATEIKNNVISGNTDSGIRFGGAGTLAGTYWIYGNKIGTNAAGTASIANGLGISADTNGSSVLDVTIGNNRDGTNDSAERNIISGNTADGISIASGSNVVVSGNYIGIDVNGTTQLANGADGIDVNATTVSIGTDNDGDATDSTEGNTISGNGANGVSVSGSAATTINVHGNFIGVDKDGAVGTNMRNVGTGVAINAASATVVNIGMVGANSVNDARNVIGNNGDAIDVQNTAASATVTIQNNSIGVDANETSAAGNTYSGGTGMGVKVNLSSGTADVVIGSDSTPVATEGNVISNNTTGVYIGNGVLTALIKGNVIGLMQVTGSYNAAAGNSGVGVYVNNADANLSSVTVGGSTIAEVNYISSNGSHAIHIADAGTTPSNLSIAGNIIGWGQDLSTARGNTGKGIYVAEGNTVSVTGNNVANSGSTGIEFTGGVGLTITGNTVGQVYGGTSAGQNASSALVLNAGTITSAVIGGATAALSNVFAGSTSGYGVYIQDLASASTAVSILGNYIGVCANISTGAIDNSNLATCKNASAGILAEEGALTVGGDNALTDAGTGTIDSGNVISNNGEAGIQLGGSVVSFVGYGNIIGLIRNGASAVFNVAAGNTDAGISIESPSLSAVTIGGVGSVTASTKRNVMSSNGSFGFEIVNAAAGALVNVVNNYIGTDWLGSTDRGNTAHGVYIADPDSVLGQVAIGGLGVDEGNVISGNGSSGITFADGTGNVNVYGNTIGLNAAKTTALANDADGVKFSSITATGKTYNVGSSSDTDGRNYISGNGGDGIDFSGSNSGALNIMYNILGLNGDGDTDLGNTGMGINLSNASLTSTIGNATSTGRNVIAGNGSYGIGITGGDVTIRGDYLGVASDGSTSMSNGTYEIYSTDTSGSVSNLRIGNGGNVINNSEHVGIRSNSNLSSFKFWNELYGDLDNDSTWLSTYPNYSYWERWVNGVLDNYSPAGNSSSDDDEVVSTPVVEEEVVVEEEPVVEEEVVVEEEPVVEEELVVEVKPVVVTEEEPVVETKPVIVPEEDPVVEPTKVQKELAKEKVEAAINTTIDSVAKAPRVNADLLYASSETTSSVNYDKLLVKKEDSVEGVRVATALDKIASGVALNKVEIKEFENDSKVLVEKKVSEFLSSKNVETGTKLIAKTAGVARDITANTKIEFVADVQKAKLAQKQADSNGDDVFVATTSTIFNGSGVAAFLLASEGGDISDKDASKKIFFAGDISGVRAKSVDDLKTNVPTLTNLRGGKELGEKAVMWITGSVGEKVSLFVVDKKDKEDPDSWKIVEFGDSIIDVDGTAVMMVDLAKSLGNESRDVELIVQNKSGVGSKAVVHYDPEVSENLEYLDLSDGKVVSVNEADVVGEDGRKAAQNSDFYASSILISSFVDEVPVKKGVNKKKKEVVASQPEDRALSGYAEPGTVIMITWKSLTYNSVVVADASQGYFELDVPEELEEGDHTVVAYSYHKGQKKVSNYTQLFFSKVF